MDIQTVSSHDRKILRDLAKKQMDYAKSSAVEEKAKNWLLHNTFRGTKPMIHLELATFQDEVVLPLLQCESDAARDMETELYQNFLNHELFDDDRVVPSYFPVCQNVFFHLFGHVITRHKATDDSGRTLGHSFDYVIRDLHDEYDKLGKSTYGADRKATEEKIAFANDIFGDILPTRLVMNGLYATPTQQIVHIMGMQNMFVAMCDYTDEFSDMMDRAAKDYVDYFKWLESQGLLLSTIGGEHLGNGSFCFTDELPAVAATTKDVWGFLDSQETVGISPDMFKELIFPCYRKIADCYGLLSYGCCEPVDPFWECIGSLENLRKVSISPWCRQEYMGEQLRGRRTVFFRKPSPNYLGVGEKLDEEAFRAHIDETLHAAAGCTLEIAQRDVYTIHHDLAKARRYIQIIREEIEKHWEP